MQLGIKQDHPAFDEARRDLNQHLLASLRVFAASRGFQAPNFAGLDQMSVAMDQVCAELLLFGLDVWPESAFDVLPRAANDDIAPPAASVRAVAARRWGLRALFGVAAYVVIVLTSTLIPVGSNEGAEASTLCDSGYVVACLTSRVAVEEGFAPTQTARSWDGVL